jgi:hypothetical protein
MQDNYSLENEIINARKSPKSLAVELNLTDLTNAIVCIFEGKQDPPYYLPFILNFIGLTFKYIIIVAGNRDRVIGYYDQYFEGKDQTEGEYYLFFVDRDFHDFTMKNIKIEGKKNLFLTENHSIENELLTEANFKCILVKYYKDYTSNDRRVEQINDEYNKFLKYYEMYIYEFSPLSALLINDITHYPDHSIITIKDDFYNEYFAIDADGIKNLSSNVVYEFLKEQINQTQVAHYLNNKPQIIKDIIIKYIPEISSIVDKKTKISELIEEEKLNLMVEDYLKLIYKENDLGIIHRKIVSAYLTPPHRIHKKLFTVL